MPSKSFTLRLDNMNWLISLINLGKLADLHETRCDMTKHKLLNALFGDETKNVDILLLPYMMCSILGLKIHMGIHDIDKINCSMETVGHITYQSLLYLRWASSR